MASDRDSDSRRLDSRHLLLAAAKDLLAWSEPSSITGRALADAAGVNYGLLHRHYRTKNALLHQALDELTSDYVADTFDGPEPLPKAMNLLNHERFWRASTNVLLDVASFLDYHRTNPVIERYVSALTDCRADLSTAAIEGVVALSVSLQIGAVIYGGPCARAAGLTSSTRSVADAAAHYCRCLEEGSTPFEVNAIGSRWRERRPSKPTLPERPPAIGEGREVVEQKLIHAGAALLVNHSPTAISGRVLADWAGVNYGMIHHYFGSKDAVLARAFRFHREAFHAAEASPTMPPQFFSTCDHPGYVRAATRAALVPNALEGDEQFPVFDQLLRRLVDRTAEPEPTEELRVALVLVVASQLAWALLAPVFEQALQTPLLELETYAGPRLRAMLASPMSVDVRDAVHLHQGPEG
jgi:AcrR family transcriptional regulator